MCYYSTPYFITMAGFKNYYSNHWTSLLGGVGYILLGIMFFIYWYQPNSGATGDGNVEVPGLLGGMGGVIGGTAWLFCGIIENMMDRDPVTEV